MMWFEKKIRGCIGQGIWYSAQVIGGEFFSRELRTFGPLWRLYFWILSKQGKMEISRRTEEKKTYYTDSKKFITIPRKKLYFYKLEGRSAHDYGQRD